MNICAIGDPGFPLAAYHIDDTVAWVDGRLDELRSRPLTCATCADWLEILAKAKASLARHR